MIRRCSIILALLVFITFRSFSSNDGNNPLNIGISPHYGFVLPHSNTIRQLADANPFGLMIDVNWMLLNENTWNYCYCYPRMGISFDYVNFGNPEILGNGYNLLYYIEPFFSYKKRLNFSFRAALGVVYLDNPYSATNNPKNLFFSSPISFPLMVDVALNYKIKPQWNIRLAARYPHISNGGIKEPNKGINYPGFSLGMNYDLQEIDLSERKKEDGEPLYEDKFRVPVMLIYSSQPTGSGEEEERHNLFGAAVNASYIVGRWNAVTSGVEWVADRSLRQKLLNRNLNEDYQRGAFLAGHELLIGKFVFSQQLGIYFYAPHQPEQPVYQRYGLRVKLVEQLLIGTNLKAHLENADFLDVRIGWEF